NEVRILRLITTDSVEEVILERAMQKLDIDGKVIQAGKFDNKSTAEEQEEFLRRLLEGETNKDTELAGELDDEELNDILARNDNERILFKKMDEQRVAAEEEEAMEMGLKKPLPRLITKEELPPIFREDITDHLQTEPVAVGRIRERKRVYYDDGLTEEQWLQAVDNDEDLDEAIERQRLARERRQRKMLGLDSQDNSVEPDEHDSVQNTEETAVPPRETGRTRSRRNVTTPAATPEEVPDVKEVKKEEEPPKKKIKLKLNMKKEEPAKVAKAEPIKPKIDSLLSNLRELVDPSDEHSRTFIFEKLPSKKDYPDYYKVIETPVALETITKKLNKKQYKSLEDVKHDFDTMFKNAKFYNEEGSWVYVDAEFLENFVNDWFGNIN
ncbi:RSC chromatin remodeling complex ATPase component, partial [Kluyveromyces marxianus]